MSKRYQKRPSEVLGIDEGYAAWCLDEACLYILCRIDQDGQLPPSLETSTLPRSNREAIGALRGVKGVDFIDKRGNNRGIPDPFDH